MRLIHGGEGRAWLMMAVSLCFLAPEEYPQGWNTIKGSKTFRGVFEEWLWSPGR